ncbi:hypothetical protein KCV05_g138, partial [Aureobasidium melanogenum]
MILALSTSLTGLERSRRKRGFRQSLCCHLHCWADSQNATRRDARLPSHLPRSFHKQDRGFLGRYFASVHSLYATDSTVGESYFDASRVVPRRQHILNNALDLTAGGLICFEDDGDCCARHYLAGIWDWHAGLIEDFFLNLFFSPLFKTMIEEDVDDNIANMSCEEDS